MRVVRDDKRLKTVTGQEYVFFLVETIFLCVILTEVDRSSVRSIGKYNTSDQLQNDKGMP